MDVQEKQTKQNQLQPAIVRIQTICFTENRDVPAPKIIHLLRWCFNS